MSSKAKNNMSEFVESYFQNWPNASVHQCVRDGLKKGVHLTPGIVTGIRLSYRQRMEQRRQELANKKSTPQTTAFTNKIHFAPQQHKKEEIAHAPPPPVAAPIVQLVKPEPVKPAAPAPQAPVTKPNKGGRKSDPVQLALMDSKKKYLNELLDKNAGEATTHLQRLLKQKFGSGLNNEYVYETAMLARKIAGIPKGTRTVSKRIDAPVTEDKVWTAVPLKVAPKPVVDKPATPTVPEKSQVVAKAPMEEHKQVSVKSENEARLEKWAKDINDAGRLMFTTGMCITMHKGGRFGILATSNDTVQRDILSLISQGYSPNELRVWRATPVDFKVSF